MRDRIGIDEPFTHWMLHNKHLMRWLCERRFRYFGPRAEFRAGAYAVGCHNISIGSRVIIRPQCMLFAAPDASIWIKDNALLGPGVHIYTNNHAYTGKQWIIDQGHTKGRTVDINRGAWIGANAIILPGVNIGECAVVAAGAVVRDDVPDFGLVGGVPAKPIIREQE